MNENKINNKVDSAFTKNVPDGDERQYLRDLASAMIDRIPDQNLSSVCLIMASIAPSIPSTVDLNITIRTDDAQVSLDWFDKKKFAEKKEAAKKAKAKSEKNSEEE